MDKKAVGLCTINVLYLLRWVCKIRVIMSAVTNRLQPKAGVMLEPLLEEIRPCIQRAQAIFSTTHYALPEDYMDRLRSLCERYFETPPALLLNDYFIKHSFSVIHRSEFNDHPGVRSRLLPLATKLWDKKDAFEQSVLEGGHPLLVDRVISLRGLRAPAAMNAARCEYFVLSHLRTMRARFVNKLQDFVEMQTQFGCQWKDELMLLHPDHPFTYRYGSHLKTFRHFRNSFLEAYNKAGPDKQQQLKEQVQDSDAELMSMLVDLGILRFLQNPTIDIELFSRIEVQELSLRTASADQNALYEKIFHGKDLPEGSVELTIYRDIGRMRSHLDRKRFNLLIHSLCADLSRSFLASVR